MNETTLLNAYLNQKQEVILSRNGDSVRECIFSEWINPDEYDFKEKFDFVYFAGTEKNFYVLCSHYLANPKAKEIFDDYLTKNGANIQKFSATYYEAGDWYSFKTYTGK